MLNKLGLDAARKWSSDLKLEGKEVTLFEAGSFMCGFNAAIALLYAEVKPENLVEWKWYWVRNCLIGTWSLEQYGGEMKAVMDFCSDTLNSR
jgi:hypothetical protein